MTAPALQRGPKGPCVGRGRGKGREQAGGRAGGQAGVLGIWRAAPPAHLARPAGRASRAGSASDTAGEQASRGAVGVSLRASAEQTAGPLPASLPPARRPGFPAQGRGSQRRGGAQPTRGAPIGGSRGARAPGLSASPRLAPGPGAHAAAGRRPRGHAATGAGRQAGPSHGAARGLAPRPERVPRPSGPGRRGGPLELGGGEGRCCKRAARAGRQAGRSSQAGCGARPAFAPAPCRGSSGLAGATGQAQTRQRRLSGPRQAGTCFAQQRGKRPAAPRPGCLRRLWPPAPERGLGLPSLG